jgi:adenylosuccinate lyase
MDRIKGDEYFEPIWGELERLLDERTFIGRAPEQVQGFLEGEVKEALDLWRDRITGEKVELKV